jgi:hypothetical protein
MPELVLSKVHASLLMFKLHAQEKILATLAISVRLKVRKMQRSATKICLHLLAGLGCDSIIGLKGAMGNEVKTYLLNTDRVSLA